MSAVQITQGIQYVAFTLLVGGMLLLSRNNRSLFWLFCNYLLGSIGLLFSALRPHEPGWLSNVAGLEIPQLRYGLLHLALICFVGRAHATRWVAVGLAVMCLPFYIAWSGTGYADPAFIQRNFAVLAAALAVQTALSAWLLLTTDEESTRLPRAAMSGFLLIYCATEIGRIVVTFAHVPAIMPALDAVSTGFYILVSSSTPIAFIWLLNARLLDDLQRQSILDPLTHLLNRRGLQRVSEREFSRSERSGRGFAIALGDIDHFKRLNDTFGHAAGDAVLRQMGAMLAELVRRGDAVARVGGEEFLIVLPETDPEAAMTMVERLREATEGHAFSIDGAQSAEHITISFGVTASHGRRNVSLDALTKEADTALYDAKQSGRNCSRFYEPLSAQNMAS